MITKQMISALCSILGNGNVTKAEFDRTWKADGLGDEERAPFFFLEMDRVADEVLNQEDFNHMFHIFDENGECSWALFVDIW